MGNFLTMTIPVWLALLIGMPITGVMGYAIYKARVWRKRTMRLVRSGFEPKARTGLNLRNAP